MANVKITEKEILETFSEGDAYVVAVISGKVVRVPIGKISSGAELAVEVNKLKNKGLTMNAAGDIVFQ